MLVEEKGINDFSLILSYVRISGVQVIQTQVEPNGYFAICVVFFLSICFLTRLSCIVFDYPFHWGFYRQ